MSRIEIVPLDAETLGRWGREATALWGSPLMVTRGRLYDVREQPGVVALLDGEFAGVCNWVPAPAGQPWEVLALYAAIEDAGVGGALLDAVASHAHEAGAPELWLVTTNDNTRALRFYQRRGWRITAIRPGAVEEARRTLKPEIPELGDDGIPIRDEIELTLDLPPNPP